MQLRTRLLLGFALTSLLPLFGLTLLTREYVGTYIVDNISANVVQKFAILSPEFDAYLVRSATELKIISQANVFEAGTQIQIAKYLQEATAESPIKNELFYFDFLGVEVARSGSITKKPKRIVELGVDSEFFDRIRNGKQGDIFHSPVVADENDQSVIYDITPVTDDSNLIVVGVLASRIPMSALSGPLELIRHNLTNGASAYLLDSSGQALTDPVPAEHSAILENIAGDRRNGKRTSDRAVAQIAETDQAGKTLLISQRVATQALGPRHAWTLVAVLPWNALVKPVNDLLSIVLAFVAGTVIVVVIVGISLSRTITGPLSRITAAARTLVDRSAPLDPEAFEPISTGPTELVLLSEALSRAIGQIASRTHDLEIARQAAEQARDDAEKSSEARAAFLAIMSHEIRTPLNGMLGMIQLLELKGTFGPQESEYLQLARVAGEGLLQILTDVLDLSKIESEAFELTETEFAIGDVVEPVTSIFSQTAPDTVAIRHDCAIAPGQIMRGDPVRIRQIIWNLVSNSVKFTEKGYVTIQSRIGTHDGRQYLSLMVTDTGIGIADDVRDIIFEPFNQADTSLTRKFEGAGLGLTIVKRLLDAMDGDISIFSPPGQGTVVSVDIPIRVVAGNNTPIPDEEPDAPDQQPAKARKKTALVVDDNKLNGLVAAEMLRDGGFTAHVARSGHEALEVLAQQPIDYVILDQHMPGMNGTATAAAIRSNPDRRIASVKIIGLTADARISNKDEMRSAGMNIVLIKPVRHEALLLALHNMQSDSVDGGADDSEDRQSVC
jgi:signal transduction histidine kinase/CheY-like chemotaxis protein